MTDLVEQKPFRFVDIQDNDDFLVAGIDSESISVFEKVNFRETFSKEKPIFVVISSPVTS